jgi:hypothetical protein
MDSQPEPSSLLPPALVILAERIRAERLDMAAAALIAQELNAQQQPAPTEEPKRVRP